MAVGYGKIVMFFGGSKWGWEEEFYWQSPDASLANILLDAKGLATARRAVLSTAFSLEAVRVSITDSSGNTFATKQNLISYGVTGALGPGLFPGACNNPWLALLLHISTLDGQYSRNYYMRGIPSAQLCMTAAYAVPFELPNELAGRLKDYTRYLEGAAGQQKGRLRIRVKDIQNRVNAVPIVDVQRLDNGHWQIFTQTTVPIYSGGGGPFVAGLGSTVHVYGPRAAWSRGFSGDHLVVNPYNPDEPLILTLSGCQGRICTIDYLQNALVAGVGNILVNIERVDPSRPVNKSTGKPFFGTRGRARNRTCC